MSDLRTSETPFAFDPLHEDDLFLDADSDSPDEETVVIGTGTDVPATSDAPTLSFDERVRQLVVFIGREPAKREVYLATLRYIGARHEAKRFDVEAYMDTLVPMRWIHQSAGILLDCLMKADALVESLPAPQYDPDIDEEVVDPEAIAYTLTDAAAAALETLAPARRLDALFVSEPGRVAGFKKLLAFCAAQPRTRNEIDALLAEDCAHEPKRAGGFPGLYPSYYADALERAGALVWDEGWRTTEEGRSLLYA
jgi:hypothetical protein